MKTQKHKYIFNNVDTEAKAYWLGFIYADGSVDKRHKRLKVALAEKDAEHLIKLKQFLNVSTELYKTPEKLYNSSFTGNYMCKPQVELSVYSVDIFNALAKYGIVPNKTHVGKIDLSTVPEELHLHFWRGMIDGDGCLTVTEKSRVLQLTGTKNTCEQFLMFIKKHFKTNVTVTSDKTVYCVKFTKTLAKHVANFLYCNSTVYLQRKKEKSQLFYGKANPVYKCPLCVLKNNKKECFKSVTAFAKAYNLPYKNVYYAFKNNTFYKEYKFISAT